MSVLGKIRGNQAQEAVKDTVSNVAQNIGGQGTMDNPQQTYFAVLEGVPTPVWYWLGIGSIAASLILKVQKRDQDALFVGQWPPTFFILALLLRQQRPSQEI